MLIEAQGREDEPLIKDTDWMLDYKRGKSGQGQHNFFIPDKDIRRKLLHEN